MMVSLNILLVIGALAFICGLIAIKSRINSITAIKNGKCLRYLRNFNEKYSYKRR